jgi:hypothetical protein
VTAAGSGHSQSANRSARSFDTSALDDIAIRLLANLTGQGRGSHLHLTFESDHRSEE